MIDFRDLEYIGFNKFSWNGGVIIEYWLPLYPNRSEKDHFDSRLGVRYGKHRDKSVNVWLILLSSMMKLHHVDTIDKLKMIYELLTGVHLTT